MASDEPDPMQQENSGDSTGFQVQANEGSNVYQAGQDINHIKLYISGGQPVINLPQPGEKTATKPEQATQDIGPCPYRGLLAYHEKDADYYFGRSEEVSLLWTRFRDLHRSESQTRLLPIYGPSGSGKSSLARAGLIPALAKQPLPGKDKARVAVFVPGTKPLQALAGILARIAQQDAMAVAKAREFARELALVNEAGDFDGLHRVAAMLPDIQTMPLVIVVDQFEEVYSLCKDAKEREAFIENLLYACSEKSQYVSAIVTFRSDFLGETSQNSKLNQLFSKPGFFAPNMDEEALREAIALPAQNSGHPLDTATINLLIEQTEGRAGALPLLQFALTQIWEGMGNSIEPAETLQAIGGVGGALAGTAQQIYDDLNPQQQDIARRCFLGLVQLGEGSQDTRRRATVNSLITNKDQAELVRTVLRKFSSTGTRLITLSSEEGQKLAEVSHEALLNHWELLRQWIEQDRDLLRKQRRIEASATAWKEQGEKAGYLLQGLPLTEAVQFNKQEKDNLPLSTETKTFIKRSLRHRRRSRLKTASWLIIPALLIGGIVEHNLREAGVQENYARLDIEGGYEEKHAVEALVKGCKVQTDFLPHYIKERFSGNCRPLNNAPLSSANLISAELSYANLEQSDLQGANLTRANLEGTDLSSANLEGARLFRANLEGTDLSIANLSSANLEGTDLSSVNLGGTNLSSADLSPANLEGTDLRTANLEGTDLSSADLSSANFTYADLEGTDLSSADLSSANFTYADLGSADLSSADLSSADLSSANLEGTDLSSADLTYADLSGMIAFNTDFRSTQNLSKELLEGDNPPLICNSPLPHNIEIDKDRDCEKLPAVLQRRYKPWRFDTLEEAQEYVNKARQKQWE